MNRTQCLVTAMAVTLGLSTLAAVPKPKAKHINGKQLLGQKVKTNGHHVIEKKGDVTATVEVKEGKVAGLKVHGKKGDLPVKKYKTDKKMASAGEPQGRYRPASYSPEQEYLGTMFIGYAYIDEYGFEEIYWFPVDMIYDGDTGAILYIAGE